MESLQHISVLPNEVLAYALPQKKGPVRLVDCTLGFGGHSRLLLEQNPEVQLLGMDRDAVALEWAGKNLSFAKGRVTLCHTTFSHLKECVANCGWDSVDAVLLDIGVSSPQIDNGSRGFSFRFQAPLDMRMDQSQKLTAADVVNTYSLKELQRIFREYGEIREAYDLSLAIVREREKKPILMCEDLVAICEKVLNKFGKKGHLPAPTLPFQAIRIEVNHELDELKQVLPDAVDLLREGGRLTVISFHSLEDRIVKHFFQDMAATCKCPPGLPVCICGWKPKLEILTKKPVEANVNECAANPRAACAKLRCAARVSETRRVL